jgi:CheY-like chemotaxis protein
MMKMKTYLMQNDDFPLDVSLLDTLDAMAIEYQTLALPADHHDLGTLFNGLESGLVFLPAVWKDLFCVKLVQEVSLLPVPFETIITDVTPDVSNLIVAFNVGLSAYLETPVNAEQLQLIILRARSSFEDKKSQISTARRLLEMTTPAASFDSSRAMLIRNSYLGKAFVDITNKTGPLFESKVEILLVSSSSVQQKQLSLLLKALGISTAETGNIKEAIQAAEEQEFTAVVSDSILPDGDATKLADRLRTVSKRMPHIIVWSSSPEKAAALLKPENHIDEVIMKPAPESGIESILPAIIAVIYRK